jgi:GT2 family glycosyltransferase
LRIAFPQRDFSGVSIVFGIFAIGFSKDFLENRQIFFAFPWSPGMTARVLISIVGHNSGRHLKTCLDSLAAQTFKDLTVSFWDNASNDDTSAIINQYRGIFGCVHFSKSNVGFCAAHNQLIASAASEYVLVMNPDVILSPQFLEILVNAMDQDLSAGSATGKLLRSASHSDGPFVLDSTGIYLTRNQRHFDRGSNEVDAGQYEKMEYVFGATGAAALYRRTMLEEIREGNEYFDENFFAYREDVDLAWRAQWMGWRCLYVPEAKAFHERRVLPERRAALPSAINMHSFKNRFLLRIKNVDCGTYARFFVPITIRDAAALAYVLLRERSSLPGIASLIRTFPRTWSRRRSLKKRRKISAREMRGWFYTKARPVSRAANRQTR